MRRVTVIFALFAVNLFVRGVSADPLQANSARLQLEGTEFTPFTVHSKVVLHGPGATAQLAQQWEDLVNQTINEAAKENSCVPMHFEIDMELQTPEFSGLTDPLNLQTGSGATSVNSAALQDLHRQIFGNQEHGDTMYVYAVDAGSEFRAFVNSRGYALWPSRARRTTIVHEMMHVLGVGDHYGNGKDQSCDYRNDAFGCVYQGNMMGCDVYASGSIIDTRNFNELYEGLRLTHADELQNNVFLADLERCLKFKLEINYSSEFSPQGPPACATDTATGEVTISVFGLASGSLEGFTLGELHWVAGKRDCSPNLHQRYGTVNPFFIDVSGRRIRTHTWDIEFDPNDRTCSIRAPERQYCTGSDLEWVFRNSWADDSPYILNPRSLDHFRFLEPQPGQCVAMSGTGTTEDPYSFDRPTVIFKTYPIGTHHWYEGDQKLTLMGIYGTGLW